MNLLMKYTFGFTLVVSPLNAKLRTLDVRWREGLVIVGKYKFGRGRKKMVDPSFAYKHILMLQSLSDGGLS